jgi:hypothetical protein
MTASVASVVESHCESDFPIRFGDLMTTTLSKTEARQGETVHRVRYVLAGSLLLAIVALAVVAWIVIV